MTQEGVIKVRSYCRKTEDERWDGEELNLAMGVPWEPIPGRGHAQVKSRVKFMDESGDKIQEPWEWDEPKVRRIYIQKEDVTKKYGAMQGCRGCEAAMRGGDPRPHNERCREDKERKLRKRSLKDSMLCWNRWWRIWRRRRGSWETKKKSL